MDGNLQTKKSRSCESIQAVVLGTCSEHVEEAIAQSKACKTEGECWYEEKRII